MCIRDSAWHVYDAFSGRSGDEILHEMLRIVSLTAVDTGAAAQRRAASLMQELADAHAKFFEADLVDREQD
jgi:hypothetical protein